MNILKKSGNNKESKLIIAGPCSAESKKQVLETAKALNNIGADVFRAGIWKPRTRPDCFEGVGNIGLKWLQKVKQTFNMQVATEAANPKHIEQCLKHEIDIIWIGSRTTVSPFAVQAIADALRGTDVSVLVKNPINPELNLWIGAIERIEKAGIKNIGAIHRGFSSYYKSIYRYNPKWKIPIELRLIAPDLPIICDPSHICGNRAMIFSVSQKAFDLLFDGLMIESHIAPDTALSDAAQQLTPKNFEKLLKRLQYKTSCTEKIEVSLGELRDQIDEIDCQMIAMLKERFDITKEIGELKRKEGITPFQPKRWNKILKNRLEYAKRYDLSNEFVLSIFEEIHEESIRCQSELT